MHAGKTEIILFATKNRLKTAGEFSVNCQGQEALWQKCVKYLGVYLDEDLSGKTMCENVIIKKKSSKTSFLFRQKKISRPKS